MRLVFGVPTGIRTPVPTVKGSCPRPLDDGDANQFFFGGGKRIRTADPLHAMQVLYQLSYTPEREDALYLKKSVNANFFLFKSHSFSEHLKKWLPAPRYRLKKQDTYSNDQALLRLLKSFSLSRVN